MYPPSLHEITRFEYRLVTLEGGARALQFDIRTRGGKAKVQLTPADTAELWAIAGEMPTQLQALVPEELWEAHRERIFASLRP